jgi:hypothetical protein
VGVRYNQAVAKGAAEFLVGAAFREDPRHVSYRNDPGFVNLQRSRLDNIANGRAVDLDPYEQTAPGVWKRIGHALYDSVSDRRSDPAGTGRRMPAFRGRICERLRRLCLVQTAGEHFFQTQGCVRRNPLGPISRRASIRSSPRTSRSCWARF